MTDTAGGTGHAFPTGAPDVTSVFSCGNSYCCELMLQDIIFSYDYIFYYYMNNFYVFTTKLIFFCHIHSLLPLHL